MLQNILHTIYYEILSGSGEVAVVIYDVPHPDIEGENIFGGREMMELYLSFNLWQGFWTIQKLTGR